MSFDFLKESRLMKQLDEISKSYKLISEGGEDPNNEDDELFGDPFADEDIDPTTQPVDNEADLSDSEPDPTETPAPEDLPSNAEGAYVSDDKLAMFAKTLLSAYMAPPGKNIPQNLLNVTRDNANEVIEFITKSLELKQPTDTIANDISNL